MKITINVGKVFKILCGTLISMITIYSLVFTL